MWNVVRAALIGLLTLSMASCGWLGCPRRRPQYDRPVPPGEVALVLLDPKDYPHFGSGFKNRENLIESIDNSLEWFKKPSSEKFYPYHSKPEITHKQAEETLKAFKDVVQKATDPSDLDRLIRERFLVYMSRGCDDRGTVYFTGYCTPIFKGALKMNPEFRDPRMPVFKGSLARTGEFRYPLYKRPAELVTKDDGTPVGWKARDGKIDRCPTRREIEVNQILAGQELVWLRTPLEAYIVHVQGNGKIQLPDGKYFNAGYHGKTDQPYTSLGLSLVSDKKIKSEELSLQKIMEYFDLHPHELETYIYRNKSYVFFTNYDAGARGSLNTPVLRHRSIATDHSVFPPGLITYMVTNVPVLRTKEEVSYEPFHSFACDQDTGGAIRAAGRCDIYMGIGPEALLVAGRTRAEGKLYYLALK